mgnify:CR=1 FL=1
MTTKVFSVLLLSTFLLSLGCQGDGKYPVSGQVTWEGESIPEDHNGHVQFMPVDESVTPDAGPIGADGRFEFRASPGEKRVEILISRPKGKVIEAMGMAAQVQYVPERYNKKTELTATVEKSNNEFQFDLVK